MLSVCIAVAVSDYSAHVFRFTAIFIVSSTQTPRNRSLCVYVVIKVIIMIKLYNNAYLIALG